MDRAFALLLVASAILAGVLHYKVRGRLSGALLAALYAFALQFVLVWVVMALMSRWGFSPEWTGLSLAAAVVAFWLWIWRKSSQPHKVDVRE